MSCMKNGVEMAIKDNREKLKDELFKPALKDEDDLGGGEKHTSTKYNFEKVYYKIHRT